MNNNSNTVLSNRGSAAINRISKGEMGVRRILRNNHIKHFRESRYEGCYNEANNQLPFDFSVYVGDKLVALIEYQGIQHSFPTFGMDDWKKLKEHDEIKRNYCKANGIPLLEIPYHKFKEIDKITVNFLNKYGIIKKSNEIYYKKEVI